MASDNKNLKPRLIFFIPSLAGGGAERVASLLARYLNNHFELLVALIENKIEYKIPENVKIYSLSQSSLNVFGHFFLFPWHVIKFIRILLEFKPKVVLSFMEQANIINLLSAIFNKHKTIISQRTNPIKQYEKKLFLGKIIKYISKTLYKKADKILSPSNGIKKILIEIYNLNEKNILFMPNPVAIRANNEKEQCQSLKINKDYILFVGRLDIKTKGLDILFRAFLIISKEFPNIALVLVGDGKDREKIVNIAKSIGIEKKIILAGWQKDPLKFMKDAKLFILSSNYEGWPNVILEAMSQGCPVIATDCDTGPREIIGENEFGMLVPVKNPQEMAKAAIKLLNDNKLREHYSKMGIKRALEFDIEIIGKKYVDAIKFSISE